MILGAWSSATVSAPAVKFQQHNGWIFVYNFCTWTPCQIPGLICIGRLRRWQRNERMKMMNCFPRRRRRSVNVWLVLNGLLLDYLVQGLKWAALCSQSFADPWLTGFNTRAAAGAPRRLGGVVCNSWFVIKHTVCLLGRCWGNLNQGDLFTVVWGNGSFYKNNVLLPPKCWRFPPPPPQRR